MKIIDVVDLSTITTTGIIFEIQKLNTITFLTSTNVSEINILYYSTSAIRTISPLYSNLIKIDNAKSLENLAKVITTIYAEKWNKTYEALMSDYNPIDNYSMTEQEVEKYGSKVTSNNTQNVQGNVYGFNDGTAQPQNESVSSNQLTQQGSADDNFRDRNLTRAGNIGVTTSQQMIQSEIDLRMYNIYKEMIKDINDICTLSIYRL